MLKEIKNFLLFSLLVILAIIILFCFAFLVCRYIWISLPIGGVVFLYFLYREFAQLKKEEGADKTFIRIIKYLNKTGGKR